MKMSYVTRTTLDSVNRTRETAKSQVPIIIVNKSIKRYKHMCKKT